MSRSTVMRPGADAGTAPGDEPTVAAAAVVSDDARAIRRRAWKLAGVFVLAYFLIGIAWIGSNPPGAAPDEPDHYVKALGLARFDIGEKYHASGATPIERRNISISRVVRIPENLTPDGYACTAFDANATAACLPRDTPPAHREIDHVTSVGAYPPFGYFLPGLLARQMDSPYRAFLAARFVELLVSCALLLLGVRHLIRWLGRWALLGAILGLTPIAVFSSSIVSTSGLEIMSAFSTAAVIIVAMRRPESLWDTGTLVTLAIAGSALPLSRQLGIVTLGVFLLVGLGCVGWRTIWRLASERTLAVVLTAGSIAVSCALVALWELKYDHPSETGPATSSAAWSRFLGRGFDIVRSGIGVFGWLDTALPRWAIGGWIILAVLLCGMAVLLGNRRDRWTVLVLLAVTFVVTYVTYSTVFHPILADLQGRHVLPMFIFTPLLAGVIVSERLQRDARDAIARLYGVVAVFMGLIQFTAVYWNGHRYAVGARRRFFYLVDPGWSPKFGWAPWLLCALAGSVLLAVYGVRCRPVAAHAGTKGEIRVER
jgi:hypothetical protein